jgi:hypothetical protein
MINTTVYVSNCGISKKMGDGRLIVPNKYLDPVSDEDFYRFSVLGGHTDDVDTELEFALLSYYSQPVINIRPVEAKNILPANNKTSELKLGAAVYQEMQMLRFLGNTDAVGRHEGIIKFITDRGNVSRAEIESYYRQGIGTLIAQVVDVEFNKISFGIDRHNAILTRNLQNGQYIYTLSYGGVNTNNEIRVVIANSPDTLRAEMQNGKNKADFTQADLSTVRAQATLIPAAIFDGWKKTTPSMVNPYELLTDALTNFYKDPSRRTYEIVRGIYARARMAYLFDRDDFTEYLWHSVSAIFGSISQELSARISSDLHRSDVLLAAAEIPNDPRYGIFTLTKTAGDAIFVSKSNPAAARQLTVRY